VIFPIFDTNKNKFKLFIYDWIWYFLRWSLWNSLMQFYGGLLHTRHNEHFVLHILIFNCALILSSNNSYNFPILISDLFRCMIGFINLTQYSFNNFLLITSPPKKDRRKNSISFSLDFYSLYWYCWFNSIYSGSKHDGMNYLLVIKNMIIDLY
jgi:hypothetical protein